jgi:hypothetical protein
VAETRNSLFLISFGIPIITGHTDLLYGQRLLIKYYPKKRAAQIFGCSWARIAAKDCAGQPEKNTRRSSTASG